jgi:glutamate synthase (NADPH/NADH) small chain
MKPRIPKIRSGKKVAVIGSGPSGLAVADQLNHRGHSVTVYEREDRIGGLLMYGIPNMKLQKEVIERRKKLMEAEGVVFKTGVNVGFEDESGSKKAKNSELSEASVTAKELLKKYDAIALCCGAKKARPLGVKGFEKVKGVHYAVDFLKSTTKSLLDNGLKEGTFISAKEKRVVIVGGGDTGNDCLATCIRHGARSVVQLEMMPEPPKVRRADNPWPEWPKVLKTDYGQQEAIFKFGSDPRIYETTVKELITKGDKLVGIKTVKVQFKNGKLTEVAGTEEEIKCDLLLIAAGFVGCEEYTANAFGVKLTERGVVETLLPDYRTNVNKVFTAGDMHRGQSLVVWAIAEGRECAREIDEYLMGYSNM